MRITAVDFAVEDLELARPYSIAFRTVNSVSNVIVRVHTDSARQGLGAGSPEPFVTGESLESCLGALEQSAAELVGADIAEAWRLCRELQGPFGATPAARAALDMAVLDLHAQLLGCPLVDVLGRAHDGLPTSITIGIKNTDETIAEAREYLGRGFRILKVKLGNDFSEDMDRLRGLRTELGGEFTIRVDPNQGYAVAELGELAGQMQQLGVEFIEQPLAVDQTDALRKLPEAVRDRVAADEMLQREPDALALLAPPRACGIWNIKLMKCGGVYPALRIANLADVAGIELMWGCMDESVISISAALHAALASPATRYLDLDGSLDLARDVATGGFELRDGVLRTTGAPGLGVASLN